MQNVKHVIVGQSLEPLIHPKIDILFSKLIDSGVSFEFITNGTLLKKAKLPNFCGSNLKAVTFSFVGGTKKTYEYLRKGADFERTYKNIIEFVSTYKSLDCKFAINSVLTKQTIVELTEIVDIWNNTGIDVVGFIALDSRGDGVFCSDFFVSPEKYYFENTKPTSIKYKF